MVAKEVYPEAPIAEEDNSRTDQWQDYYDDDDEEGEEALSLCDLPIYSGSVNSDNHFSSYASKEDYQSSILDDQDFFEFFSGDLSTASSTYISSAEDIIFCGKLIPYKAPPTVFSQEKTHKFHQINTQQQQQQQQQQLPKKKKSFFHWRSKSSDNSKTSKDNTSKRIINSSTSTNTNTDTDSINKKNNYFEHQKKSVSTTSALPASSKCSANNKYGYSVKKVSILASPTKSRWHLFLFGFRFPTEMDLSDMRSRQHRRSMSSSTMSPSFDEADEGKEVKAGRTTRGKRLWRLLRVLGCYNTHANTVVKASLGCIPRL